MPNALAVIPARFASTRFPGKPLADKTGKPLIQHVVERVRLAKRIGAIVVATDDQRIFEAVQRFGGQAVMTRADHPNGTSRIAEVVEKLSEVQGSKFKAQSSKSASKEPAAATALAPGPRPLALGPATLDIIVNVQGDEPEIEPELIDKLIDGLQADPDAPMATLASEFAPDEDPSNPNIVKLVLDQRGRAMYFSRSLIPFDRDKKGHRPLKHPGLYAYRRDFLLKYVTLPATPLEQAEQLEQLRALEHGYPIAVIKAQVRHHGIDTPEQYEAFVRRMRRS